MNTFEVEYQRLAQSLRDMDYPTLASFVDENVFLCAILPKGEIFHKATDYMAFNKLQFDSSMAMLDLKTIDCRSSGDLGFATMIASAYVEDYFGTGVLNINVQISMIFLLVDGHWKLYFAQNTALE